MTRTKSLRAFGGPLDGEMVSMDLHRHDLQVLVPSRSAPDTSPGVYSPTPQTSFYQVRTLVYDKQMLGQVLIFEDSHHVADYALRQLEVVVSLAYLCVPVLPVESFEVLRRHGLFSPSAWPTRLHSILRWDR